MAFCMSGWPRLPGTALSSTAAITPGRLLMASKL
jgi:hypothetical protein